MWGRRTSSPAVSPCTALHDGSGPLHRCVDVDVAEEVVAVRLRGKLVNGGGSVDPVLPLLLAQDNGVRDNIRLLPDGRMWKRGLGAPLLPKVLRQTAMGGIEPAWPMAGPRGEPEMRKPATIALLALDAAGLAVAASGMADAAEA